MTPRKFGTLPSGDTVEAHTLANGAGASVEVLNYGGIVTSLRMPDRMGRSADVVLGYRDLDGYLMGRAYLGAIIGRVAGRIRGGLLDLEGKSYPLGRNEGANHLHGGHVGLDRRIWTAEPVTHPNDAPSLRLRYRSPDGEEGYPGAVDIVVTYTLTDENALVIESEATADRVTPLCLTHHSYFNLAGEGSGDVLRHEFQINADRYAPATEDLTLADRAEVVTGTGLDLRQPRRLGEALSGLPGGHGALYLLGQDKATDGVARLAARVSESASGRVLEVFTDEPCLQFYTGAMLDAMLAGKSGSRYGPFAGFCLECQGHPNTPSPGVFGDILVCPSRPQRRRTVYAFSTN
jgi:aldose 1-epimerase